ncbi:MAG: PIN domain-containing protein [Pseudomonadota bacterium]
MPSFRAVLEANVLFSAPQRDLLLELALADFYQARWSETILAETKAAILKHRPDIAENRLDRTIKLMNANVRDCLIEPPVELISAIGDIPDPNDRHVLATAIVGQCQAIVTWNMRDFPASALERYGVEAIAPDDFLVAQFDLNEGAFLAAVVRVRQRLKNPEVSSEKYLSILIKNGFVGTAAKLREFARFI